MHLPPHWPDHPLLAQSALELSARIRRWRSRPSEALFHALAIVVLTGLGVAALAASATRLEAALDQVLALPLPGLAVLTAALLWRLRRSSAEFLRKARSAGWLSALPVSLALHRRGLVRHLALNALGLASAGLLGLLVLGLVLPLEPVSMAGLLGVWLTAVLLALLGACVLAIHGLASESRGPGIGHSETVPLRSAVRAWSQPPRWLGPWPELGQLQRRTAQRGWRSGRAWVWLLPLGLLVLAGEGARVLAGMLLLVGMLPWLRTVLDSSARALAEAECLLLATPRSPADYCRSGWRYPASRVTLASLMLAIALALFGAPPWVLVLGVLAFVLACALEIALMLHYPRSRARQRGQLIAELTLLLVLAREGLGPAVLLIAVAMVAWHGWRARRLP